VTQPFSTQARTEKNEAKRLGGGGSKVDMVREWKWKRRRGRNFQGQCMSRGGKKAGQKAESDSGGKNGKMKGKKAARWWLHIKKLKKPEGKKRGNRGGSGQMGEQRGDRTTE